MIERPSIPNRSSFITYSSRNINSSLPATQLADINIPDGFAVVVRANPLNTADIFVSFSSAATSVAATRARLTPGEAMSLYITNTNLVYVLGNAASQSVDYWVEQ